MFMIAFIFENHLDFFFKLRGVYLDFLKIPYQKRFDNITTKTLLQLNTSKHEGLKLNPHPKQKNSAALKLLKNSYHIFCRLIIIWMEWMTLWRIDELKK